MKKNVRNILSAVLAVALLAVLLVLPAMAEGTTANTVTDATQLRNAVAKGGAVILGADIDIGDGAVEIDKTVVLDLNGKTLSCPGDTKGDGVFHVVAGGKLTINGDGTINSKGNNNYSMAIWADGGEVIINGGTYTNKGCKVDVDPDNNHYDLIYVKNGGSVSIHGGTFECEIPKWTLNSHDSLTGTFQVHGGAFMGFDPTAADTEPGDSVNWVVKGSACTAVGSVYNVTGVAAIGNAQYATLQAAIDAAKDGDTIEILKDQTLTAQHVIEKDITINGNGFELTTSTVERLIRIFADATINDLTVTNTYSGGRCIETRVGGITLNLNNVTLTATKGSTQVLTVGGNAGTAGDVIVNLNNCHINSSSVGYGIITFNPVKLTIENSSAVCGYGALYLKPADSSVGSVGSVVEIKNSTLRSDGRNDGYAFGTVIIQDNNITVNVDEKSELIATNPENSTGRQYAIMISDLDMSKQPAVYTGITVNVAGKITADYHISNLTSLENVIYVPAEYKEAIEAFTTYKYLTTAAGNGLFRVWANHDHDLDKTGAVKETCMTDGNTDYYTCSICGKLFADEKAAKEITLADTVIEAPGHKIVHVEATASTCTKDGNEEYWYCETCSGEKIFADKALTTETTLEKVTVPAGHNYTSHVYAKDATCIENGCVEYWACNDCLVVEIVTENGRVESTQDKAVIPAKGHTMTKVETKTPTCTGDGNVEYYSCSVCKKNFADEKGEKELTSVVEAAKGHKLTKVEAKAATCTEAGVIAHYNCSVCEKNFADEKGEKELTSVVEAAKGHKLTKVEAKAATYAEAGNIEHYACACGKLFADAEGKKEITDVVIPQLIKVEEEKAEVSEGAVDNALADAKEKAEETGKPVEVVIEVPKAPVVEKPEGGETGTPEEKPEQKPQEVVKVELPVQALETVAKEEANLTVVMPSVTVTVDTDALKAVTEQAAGNTVTLVVEQIKEETLTEKQQEAVKNYDVAVTIKAEFICQETNEKIWTEDNNAEKQTGSVTVKMPFTPAEGSKGSDYTVLYIADDGSVKEIKTSYEDGNLVFDLEHFSEYIVVNTKTSVNPDTGDHVMLAPFALLVLSVMGMAVMVAGKKKLI